MIAFSSFLFGKAPAPKPGGRGVRRGFSLIEVVFAIAVFSFSMLTIVGLLATGLHSASDASRNTALANIQRLTRANVSAMSYTGVGAMTTNVMLFTAAGYPTTSNSTNDVPYYTLTYTTNLPTGIVSSLQVTGTVVKATVTYPYNANVSTNTFSLFIAQ